MTHEIVDIYGRTFKTLRVSLTNVCNLACLYCVHSNKEILPVSSKRTIGYKELASIVKKIHEATPLDTIRLTGGEPTLYKDLIPFINELKPLGIQNLKMTSNGYLLKDKLPQLNEAGLKKINISLDTIEPKKFQEVSGKKNLAAILDSIDHALTLGMEIKLNAVILKNINEDQIIPLLKFAIDKKIPLRFLELMKMGPLYENPIDFQRYFLSEQEILERIKEYIPFEPLEREESATANYWITDNGFKFGIIANESSPFCHDCNRLRLDSFGNIYGCLSNEAAISMADILEDDFQIRERLAQALSQKQSIQFKGSSISMMAIGG